MLRKIAFYMVMILPVGMFVSSFKSGSCENLYTKLYTTRRVELKNALESILEVWKVSDTQSILNVKLRLKNKIHVARQILKSTDFWYRYFEPIKYKLLNGPLLLEWETEVFEKFEKPYKREGQGLTLAELYLETENFNIDTFKSFIFPAIKSLETFGADSITSQLNEPNHFYFVNRLFLLNLSSIYTTGFECPDTNEVIPELFQMLKDYNTLCTCYFESFSNSDIQYNAGARNYLSILENFLVSTSTQKSSFSKFDRLNLLDFAQKLYDLNQQMFLPLHPRSKNNNDYAIESNENRLYSKTIFNGQNAMGMYASIKETSILREIKSTGKMLFYDPILSGNNKRSCASCHKPNQFLTDTAVEFALNFDGRTKLKRNTPSLINVVHNHLLMIDGAHINMQNQALWVIQNPEEMNGDSIEVLKKVLSCKQYLKAFKKFNKHARLDKSISLRQIVSTITTYTSGFSKFDSRFDRCFSDHSVLSASEKMGFNLFMGKAQCGTCHFFPAFNGVKPPFVGSEFEVVGTPEDSLYKKLSSDKGRYLVSSVAEMFLAFRTPTLRNVSYTKPYMHNGVFTSLEQVVEFYDAGGGIGHGLNVPNQTLSSDSLHLSKDEKLALVDFLKSLNENYAADISPVKLPKSKYKRLNARKISGEY